MYLKKQKFYILFLGLAMIISSTQSSFAASRMKIRKSMKLPIPEVSALHVREVLNSQKFRIFALGDQESRFLTIESDWKFSLSDYESTSFRDQMRSRFLSCSNFANPSCKKVDRIINADWEAIVVDGGDRRFLLQEYSGLVFVLDATGRYLGDIQQSYPSIQPRLGASTGLKIGSQYQGEGLVLMKNGHLLLAFQDEPSLLVEMAPRGEKSLGLKPDSFLPRMDRFSWPGTVDNPAKVKLEAVSVWTVKDFSKCDLNEIVYDWRQRRLLGLSKKCNKVVRLEQKQKGTVEATKEWKLPKKTSGAEGLAVLSDGSWLVASDRPQGGKHNLYWLRQKKK